MRLAAVHFLQEHGLTAFVQLVPTPQVLYQLAMAGVVVVFLRRCQKAGLPFDRALPAAAMGALGTLAGARLYYLLGTGTGVTVNTILSLRSDGAGSWGGYIGGFVGIWAYLRLARTDPLPYLDAVSGAAALAPIIGRWGCLLAGCDFGRITAVPWAIHYPPGSPTFVAHVQNGLLAANAPRSLPVHPLPIYLSLNGLVLFVIITAIWRRTRHRPGMTVAAAWVLYGVSRFFLEFLRDPAASWAEAGISIAQWMALASIGIGLAIAVGVSRRATSSSPAPMRTASS